MSSSEEDTLFNIISNGSDAASTELFMELVLTLEQDLFSELTDNPIIKRTDEDYVVGQQAAV